MGPLHFHLNKSYFPTLGTSASSTTKTGRHDIAEILLKVVLKHQKSKSIGKKKHFFYGNSKPDNVLCILFVTCHKSTIVMQDFYFLFQIQD
jgi:hypothetical protein